MTYDIEEKSRPEPRPGTLSKTLRALHVDQSFLIPDADIKDVKKTQAAVHTLAKNFDIRCATRKVEGGLRVYRVPKVEKEDPIETCELEMPDEEPMSHKEKIDALKDLANLAGI